MDFAGHRFKYLGKHYDISIGKLICIYALVVNLT